MSNNPVQVRGKLAGRVALVTLCVACGGEDDPSASGVGGSGGAAETRVLRVASSWASAGDQEALQIVLRAYTEQTGGPVEVVALEQGQAERTAQYQTGEWDVGQENFFFLAESFADGNAGYTALDLASDAELAGGLAKIFPQVKALLTVDGQVIGLPMNLHRENTLIYSRAAMPSPPTNLAQLRQVCTDYVSGGKTGAKPLAIARADWLYRILFEALLPAPVLGATSDHPLSAFTAATELIRYYIDNECLWTAPSEHGWGEAAHALIDGDAMMYIHGDWAKAYLVQLGWTPGVDFDAAPAPGSEGAFYYGIDVFAVNKSSPQVELGLAFARIALGSVVQAEFSAKKGSTPGIVFDDPDQAFSDPSLRSSYAQLAEGMQNGAAVPVQPWMGLQGNSLIVPLRDGTRTPAEVAADFMTVYPTAP